MQVSVTFRNMEPKEPVREYVLEKIGKMKKYSDVPLEANVVLTGEKHRQIAEVTLTANRLTINAQDENEDMLAAIDRVVDKLERQILKHKEKIKQHKTSPPLLEGSRRTEGPGEESRDETGEHKVMKTKKWIPQFLSVEEAALQMEALNYDFLIFKNSSSKDHNVLYRLDDGNYGLLILQMD
jgi:putative sigma-54 modulation protein